MASSTSGESNSQGLICLILRNVSGESIPTQAGLPEPVPLPKWAFLIHLSWVPFRLCLLLLKVVLPDQFFFPG